MLLDHSFVMNWKLLLWQARPSEQFKNCYTAPWKFSEWIYRTEKAEDNTKNKIKGYPRVEGGNIPPVSLCKQFWNIPIPFWFLRNPPRERPDHLDLNNSLPSENYNWNLSGLQLTQKKTHPRKNSLRLQHSIFWPASGRRSRWNITANQKTANHKYCFSTNQKKTESVF